MGGVFVVCFTFCQKVSMPLKQRADNRDCVAFDSKVIKCCNNSVVTTHCCSATCLKQACYLKMQPEERKTTFYCLMACEMLGNFRLKLYSLSLLT